MEWIMNNKEWIFSGVGVVFISFVIGLLFKNKSKSTEEKSINRQTTMTQKSGKNSTNIQINGDYNNGK